MAFKNPLFDPNVKIKAAATTRDAEAAQAAEAAETAIKLTASKEPVQGVSLRLFKEKRWFSAFFHDGKCGKVPLCSLDTPILG